MNVFLLAMTMVISALTTSCVVVQEGIVPSKNYVTKQVKWEPFDGISTSTSLDVVYDQSSDIQQIEIYAPDNLMEFIKVDVVDGILKVRLHSDDHKGIHIKGKHHTEIRVSAPDIHAFYASSSGNIVLKNGLQTSGKVCMKSSSSGDIKGGEVVCDDLLLQASSSGDVALNKVDCAKLKVEASSSGDVEIMQVMANEVVAKASSSGDVILADGACEKAEFEASSSGDVEAKDLRINHVIAKASSSGDVTCYAKESLKATSSSSGSIGYRGNPTSIDYSPKQGLHKLD